MATFERGLWYGTFLDEDAAVGRNAESLRNDERVVTRTFDAIRGDRLRMISDRLPLTAGSEAPPEIPARLIVARGSSEAWAEVGSAPEAPPAEGNWYAMSLKENGRIPADFYASSTARRTVVKVATIRPASKTESQELDRLTTLEKAPAPTDDDWHRVEASVESCSEVHVYNVGQASCAALAGVDHCPRVYCDFGAPTPRNQGTWPSPTPVLCVCREPIVILSHWHLDHWGAGRSVVDILKSLWVTPLQARINISALSWAAKLHAGGVLRVIHDKQLPKRVAALRISKGRGSKPNDSGLVLESHLCSGTCLIPGDCDPQYLSLSGAPLAACIASHHGARIGGLPPSAAGRGRIAYSYGAGNSHGHPDPASVHTYSRAGWGVKYDTVNGNVLLMPVASAPVTSACTCSVHIPQV